MAQSHEQPYRLDWASERDADYAAITVEEINALAKKYLGANNAIRIEIVLSLQMIRRRKKISYEKLATTPSLRPVSDLPDEDVSEDEELPKTRAESLCPCKVATATTPAVCLYTTARTRLPQLKN